MFVVFCLGGSKSELFYWQVKWWARVLTTDKCRLLVPTPNSNMDGNTIQHCIVQEERKCLAALHCTYTPISHCAIGGKILLTTAFKCWLLSVAPLHMGRLVYYTRFSTMTVRFSWWLSQDIYIYVVEDLIWIWQTRDSKTLANKAVDEKGPSKRMMEQGVTIGSLEKDKMGGATIE